ncbi:gliding motility-associated C-terminal domain-containing protein [Flavobacterium terrisoli]|uniref:T9SS type B sorting domain-containing protein n=1 Tax=Flavobacterium terrisoli TaxID=3242195 RepID=UPI0025434A3C|nr:gliding motility-associated C-terminal domain-containing protein [Flavobacterium buctense]
MDHVKLKFTFVLLLFTQLIFSQLSNFTLTVTRTNETCTANGTLTFNVSNTTTGSTILYSIYRLPNLATPISVQSTNTLTGLIAGTYRVIATQSLGADSGTQQQDIVIDDLVVPLTYQVSGIREICGNDGVITINVLTGTAVNYEIFSGPMIRPLQASNIFTGMTAGVYQIRVFDNCGEGVVQTFTLLESDPALTFELNPPALASCTTVSIGADFESVLAPPNGVVKYPLQVVTTLYPPTGPPVTYTQTVTNFFSFSQIVPLYPGQTYNYTFAITDGCGVVYTLNGVIDNLDVSASYMVLPQDCTHQQITFFNVSAVTLVSAPSGFTTSLPQSYTGQINNNSVTIGGLIEGTYVFNTIDVCGNPETFTVDIIIPEVAPPFVFIYNVNCVTGSVIINGILGLVLISAPPAYDDFPLPHDYTSLINSANYITFENIPVGTYTFDALDLCGQPQPVVVVIAPAPQIPVLTVSEGCQDGFGSFKLAGQFNMITMTSAPAAYGATLPLNLTGSLVANGATMALVLDMLPPGTYVIQSLDLCNNIYNTTVTIQGHQDNTNVIITPNCGSFNLDLNNTSNSTIETTSYWLQKLDTLTNTWGHPLTGVVYINGTYPSPLNSVPLNNNSINYNLAYQGHFRILKVFESFEANNPVLVDCFKTIHEFDFNGLPRINDVYSVSCGTTFEVIVLAEGFNPLLYRITTRNGDPFLVENGNSNIFTGLQPATYNFQVEDACGNLLNSAFEILSPNPLAIQANAITCDGENLTLTVPDFAFFQYEWWKDNNTTTILSTSSSLTFTPFNSVVHNGTYHVRITYINNPGSCLNQVLDYTINISNIPPNAGNGGSFDYCGSQGNINLFTLLQGSYDTDGTWSEMTSSGTLSNNIWNSTTVPYGSYEFRYHVDGTCGVFEESFINITINEIPQIPTATAGALACEGASLNLYATNIPNATYQWTGPNGFTSSDQNPLINNLTVANNGTYSVTATQNSCLSGSSSVEVFVNPLPEFELSQDCIENEYVVTATPINNSFDALTANYAWTGPNNFTDNQNPILITGEETGLYNLTITVDGCSATQSIDVVRTICYIPNVITPNDDATNDSFNLSGFEVDRIEIYNRWGRKVYEKNNYIDEWHGQNMKGERLPDSTYYYILSLRTGENKVGWVFVSDNR